VRAARPASGRALAACAAAVAIALSGGCHFGVYRAGDDRFLAADLDWQPGVTTAREVARTLGPPDLVRESGPRMTFLYRFQRRADTRLAISFYLKLFQREQESQQDSTLLVAFDADDRLLYYGRSDAAAEDLAGDLGLR
jgi:hypothetical protein